MTERRCKLLVVAAVWLSFLLVSLVSAPIPAVNEPHYLAMARHLWDSSWCANDMFLSSFPAHRVFYWTFGWLTLWFDFATVAFLGRAISLAMLAASWTSLATRLQCEDSGPPPPITAALLSAWLFLGLQAVGNLSGEWLIGGFESKVVAYAFVFWNLKAIFDGRPMLASVCAGAAVSFHPIIGIWHVLAMMLIRFWQRLDRTRSRSPFRLKHLVIGQIVAIPGYGPALAMLRSADPQTSFAANYIQVFYRLKHHLDPMDFGWTHFAGYGLLAVLWLTAMAWLRRQQRLSERDRWWIRYLFVAALFAVGGLLAGLGPRPAELMAGYRWRMVLLKFYPFRLFDLLLPIATAIVLPRLVKQRWLWLVGGFGFLWALASTHTFPPPNQLPTAMRTDWRDVCRWVATNTPADTVFHTPFEAEAFKWFAQRAEYVNLKDCPQDAAGIVEWNRRLRLITKWSEKSFQGDETYSTDELRELVRQTGVRFAITRTRVRYDADLMYSNDTYKILRLPEAKSPFGR